MKSIKTRLEAGYQRLRDGRHFGRHSTRSYFAAGELLAFESQPTTITPQADAVTPLAPHLEDERVACWADVRHPDQSVRRERIFQRNFHLSGGQLLPT